MTGADELLALAVRAAEAAGDELLRRYGVAQRVTTKTSGTDPVSEADQAAEALLVELLLGERPNDGVLGEEGADRVGGSGLRWVLDPLDGTVNYLYGLPAWCVSVACEDADGALVGVVRDPLHHETFTAARGRGASLGDTPLAVNDPVALERALVATGFGYDGAMRAGQGERVAQVLPLVRDVRRAGSCALDLCSVAAGRMDAYFEVGPQPWDWAAGGLIAAEAGARVTTYEDPCGRGLLAAGPALHDPMLALVTDHRPAAKGGNES